MDTTYTQPVARDLGGLAADDWGRPDDRAPLVLLHGMTFDRTIWSGLIALLQSIDPGRRVIAIDLPGHGRSPEQASYELADIPHQLHRAVAEAGIEAPVVVGHSVSGLAATIYASEYPTRGVVNVDQPLSVAGFAAFVRSMAPRLRGPDFATAWKTFDASWGTEVLPPAMRELVRSTSAPKQEVVLGYWAALMERPTEETISFIDTRLAELRDREIPYLHIAGSDPGPGYRQWLADRLPTASISVWPGSGHFPHLASPTRFADVLVATAQWQPNTTGSPR